jgi:lysophospholipase L1-like esterase
MTQITSMAALGSSYAAGPGIAPVLDWKAMRSGRNYAHVAAARLGARLTDLTVSGAVTANILDTPQRVLLRSFAPQLDGVPAGADLVTVTAGGNDLGYIKAAAGACSAAVVGAVTRGRIRVEPDDIPAPAPAAVEAAAHGLTRIVEALARRCPGARVILVDYPPLFGDPTLPQIDAPLTAVQVTALRALYDGVVAAFVQAAEISGATLVQASALGRGHELGSADPWVSGFHLAGRGSLSSLHPNAAGMRAIGERVAEVARQ